MDKSKCVDVLLKVFVALYGDEYILNRSNDLEANLNRLKIKNV